MNRRIDVILLAVSSLLFADYLTKRRQIVKRQLRIVDLFCEFAMTDSVTRHIQRFAHGVEVETNYVGRDANGRDAPLARKPSHCRLANLQHLGKLASGKEFFTLFHGSQ